MEAVVLTSENAPAFYAKKLGLDAPEPAATDAAPDTPEATNDATVESAAPGGEKPEAKEADAQQKGPTDAKQKVHLRFSELSKERDEAKVRAEKAEADAKTARDAAALAERRAAELAAKYEPPKRDALGPKPERSQFVNEAEHEQALIDWSGEKAVRDKETKDAQERMAKAWTERQQAAIAELPDYEQAIGESANLMVSNEVRDAILESEAGPKLLYHLAKNPALVAELAKDSSTTAVRKIGRLEAKLLDAKAPAADPPAGKTEPAKTAAAAAELSRAPAPITPLKGANAPVEPPIDSRGEFVGTYADWKRLRQEGKIK